MKYLLFRMATLRLNSTMSARRNVNCQSFYNEYKKISLNIIDPPRGLIAIKNLQKICIQRLKLYLFLEKSVSLQNGLTVSWYSTALESLKENFPEIYSVCIERGSSFRELKARYYNSIGRFIVLHAVIDCNLGTVINWIIRSELRLFRIHYHCMSIQEQKEFLMDNSVIMKSSNEDGSLDETYEVLWTDILPLVKTRSVSLVNGRAYIKASQFSVAACSFQMKELTRLLTYMKKYLLLIKLDPRLEKIINETGSIAEKCAHKLEVGEWLMEIDTNDINLENIDDISKHFPPCMTRMYQQIERKHHIRYGGRRQLIPFFKDIGLSVTDTLQYFQQNFKQVMTEKEYKNGKYDYFIRHQFGLEGGQLEYHSANCLSMKNDSIEHSSDCHGCPFTSVSNTKELFNLPNYDFLDINDKDALTSLVDKVPANKICGKLLNMRLSKNQEKENVIISPVHYYAVCKKESLIYDEDFY